MIHGSIAAVVVFLLWVYVSSVILMYGVEFTAAYARLRRRRPRRDAGRGQRRGYEGLAVSGLRSTAAVVTLAILVCPHRQRPSTLVSVEAGDRDGKQANEQVRKQMPELSDAVTVRTSAIVGQRLARAATGPKYPYTFAVADTREINAFSLPGGPVWINRGVLSRRRTNRRWRRPGARDRAHRQRVTRPRS